MIHIPKNVNVEKELGFLSVKISIYDNFYYY